MDFDLQGVSEEEEMIVKKYLRGEAADLGVKDSRDFYYYYLSTVRFLFGFCDNYLCYLPQMLQDKKLKGQLAVREELYGKSAQAAAKAEKVTPCFAMNIQFALHFLFL